MTTHLSGLIQKIVFRNAQNGYTVLRVIPDDPAPDGEAAVTVVGSLAQAEEERRARFVGDWVENERFGRQFKAETFTVLTTHIGGTAEASGDTVMGTITQITFYNPETSWGVLRIAPLEAPPAGITPDGTLTVVGVMPELVEGEVARFTGKWVTNAQYGRQFKAETVIPLPPQNKEGILRYLSDHVTGIGPRSAERIYAHFGDQTLAVLDTDPARIYDVPDLRAHQKANFVEIWTQRRAERQVLIHLQSYGLTSGMAQRIYSIYGAETLAVVRANPYQLADTVEGIGFKRADALARGMGLPVDAPERLRAGLEFALNQLASDGHTFAARPTLIATAAELLGSADPAQLDIQLTEALLAERLFSEKLVTPAGDLQAIYLPMYYYSERGAAHRLRTLAQTPSDLQRRMRQTDWAAYLAELAEQNAVSLTEQQQSAVRAALTGKVSVLTGGPGTGKTTTLQMVIHALEAEEIEYALASPTGRAAKRLSEATERDASTIHRLLAWGPEGFGFNEDHPLAVAFLVIDEASMIDLILLHHLLKALHPTTHLLLVGDVDQLPSVGAGNVLNDVIASGIAQVTRLNQIFRQAQTSHIIVNAHRINSGQMPLMENQSDDFFFFSTPDPANAAELIVDIVQNRLEKKIGPYNRFNDVQVIAPMYRGQIGVDALNLALQQALNPRRDGLAERKIGGTLFRVGDKVMQTRNNYDKDIFNGDIGRVRAFDFENGTMEVIIDGEYISYEFDEAAELIHAYCISTHRSQGSEYPVVVMPIMGQHFLMLQRNLLYTAITRARQMVVLVGEKKAVGMAVNNNKVAERYSGLLPRLSAALF